MDSHAQEHDHDPHDFADALVLLDDGEVFVIPDDTAGLDAFVRDQAVRLRRAPRAVPYERRP